ncbi:MAG: hypothetical protein J6M36_00575 [Prevotella sp.]|nr:hypothetical protein [Prevotella sp.]
MKNFLFLIFFLSISNFAFSQFHYDSKNSIKVVALVKFDRNSDTRLFEKKEYVILTHVYGVINLYAYNKKTKELYVTNHEGNYVVTLNEETAKQIKKNKSIPQLKDNEIAALIKQKNAEIEEAYCNKNAYIIKEKEDSIAKAKSDSLEKVKRDSIKHVEDSIKAIRDKEIEQEYVKTHKWFALNVKGNTLRCEFCDGPINDRDTIFCYSIQNDTIFFSGKRYGKLGLPIKHIHAAPIPENLKNDSEFNYHRRLFKDSLTTKMNLNTDIVRAINYDYINDYFRLLKKEAPHGLFTEWGWDNEYSISFNFRYLNTNKKTIKYIEVFWVLKNDVGDIRRTGSFRGTGPLAEFESAEWSWDHSHYYASGDASKMSLSKVLITYMDGTKVTIPKNKIRID